MRMRKKLNSLSWDEGVSFSGLNRKSKEGGAAPGGLKRLKLGRCGRKRSRQSESPVRTFHSPAGLKRYGRLQCRCWGTLQRALSSPHLFYHNFPSAWIFKQNQKQNKLHLPLRDFSTNTFLPVAARTFSMDGPLCASSPDGMWKQWAGLGGEVMVWPKARLKPAVFNAGVSHVSTCASFLWLRKGCWALNSDLSWSWRPKTSATLSPNYFCQFLFENNQNTTSISWTSSDKKDLRYSIQLRRNYNLERKSHKITHLWSLLLDIKASLITWLRPPCVPT